MSARFYAWICLAAALAANIADTFFGLDSGYSSYFLFGCFVAFECTAEIADAIRGREGEDCVEDPAGVK